MRLRPYSQQAIPILLVHGDGSGTLGFAATVAKAIGRICTSHDELAIRALEDRVNDEREYQEVRLAADEALINLVGGRRRPAYDEVLEADQAANLGANDANEIEDYSDADLHRATIPYRMPRCEDSR